MSLALRRAHALHVPVLRDALYERFLSMREGVLPLRRAHALHATVSKGARSSG
jgi:hypothetical protein